MKTYEEVVKYLKSYKEFEFNVEYYRNKMNGLKSISYSLEEKSTVQNNMTSIYMEKIDESQNKMLEIEKFIENNFVGQERFAIWEKYILKMQNKEISASMGFSNGYAHQFIKKALIRYVEKHIQ
ncbi:hypothetical protein [Coprobacillus cateniformis]|uniref:hypothetical protein n=1 Tax=Coprobacillus cateniformis TaxID=100884 RepID=UPI00399F08C7